MSKESLKPLRGGLYKESHLVQASHIEIAKNKKNNHIITRIMIIAKHKRVRINTKSTGTQFYAFPFTILSDFLLNM